MALDVPSRQPFSKSVAVVGPGRKPLDREPRG